MPRVSNQKGLSMIEVLVAITILSIGLLGTAALQIQSKRANLGSVERTLASMLVNDMFERMRANPTEFNTYLTEMDQSQKVGETGGTEPRRCVDQLCDEAQLAAWDVWDWEQSLIGASEVVDSAGTDINTGGLVLPFACMVGPPGGGTGLYRIAINWRGHSEFTDGSLDDPCGVSDLDRYAGEEDNDTLRRVIVVSSYLVDPDE